MILTGFGSREVDALRAIDVNEIENAYLISDVDIVVNDEFIQDIQLTALANGERMKANVLLKNNADTPMLMPNVELIVLNKYGIKIGESSIGRRSFDPSERTQEIVHFLIVTHDRLFKYSHLGPVGDFNKPHCVVITYKGW